ncbi:MAG TPA: DUF4198 domain-containing protein [Pyrinomonadaceae bacterium]|nr:DUF4198 domain-containing protein [Pyrinomonadaceae bacterium]
MLNRRTLTLAALLVLLCTARALTHDYWLEPQAFFVRAGVGRAVVRMHVGMNLKSEAERPLQKDRTVKFQLFSGAETQDLLASAQDNRTPVADVRLARSGTYLFALERKAATIKLDAPKFKEYLLEEGLESIIAERERARESASEGRERYTRYLKTLVQAGSRRDDTYRREVGQRLEIIPQENPYNLQRAQSLGVRVMFEGRPLAGVRVFAQSRNAGKDGILTATTDADGRASFKLQNAGIWAIRLIHMRRCAGADCADIDWESFWSSYTFGMR